MIERLIDFLIFFADGDDFSVFWKSISPERFQNVLKKPIIKDFFSGFSCNILPRKRSCWNNFLVSNYNKSSIIYHDYEFTSRNESLHHAREATRCNFVWMTLPRSMMKIESISHQRREGAILCKCLTINTIQTIFKKIHKFLYNLPQKNLGFSIIFLIFTCH